MDEGLQFSDAWKDWRRRVDLGDYNARWDRLEAEGQSVHDEAHFVHGLLKPGPSQPRLVLDAGCGTGRVAAELARLGHRVVGVDLDPDMLAYAEAKPVQVRWQQADLSSMSLPDRFDAVVMAGNILAFVEAERRSAVVANLADHLLPGGRLICGAGAAPSCGPDELDRWCADVGLVVEAQFATWDRRPLADGDYRVSVHRRER